MDTPGHGTQLLRVHTCFTEHYYCIYTCEHMTRILYCTHIVIIIISLLHRLTYMYVMIDFVFCCFMLHELLLHGYSYIPVTGLSPVIDIDIHICILLLDLLAFDTRCVIGDTSRVLHLLFPVILFNDINIAHVQ